MKYNLIVAEPGKEAIPYELNAERVGLGRGPENQIQVPSEFISHTHLEFHRDGADIVLQDLGSKNGTRVNGNPVDGKITLRDGDRILIGECVGAHLLLLPDDAEPFDAAPRGDAAKHKAAATYTTLDQKIQDLETKVESKQSEAEAWEEKIAALSGQFDARRKEFDQLENSVSQLRDRLESKREAVGDNLTQEAAAEIAAIEKDILKQTQKITVLKSDLDKREAEISQLQSTAKVQIAKAVDSDGEPVRTPAPTAIPAPPPSSPASPAAAAPAPTPTVRPVAPPTAIPAKPAPPTMPGAAAPPAPPSVGGAKPPTPAAPTVRLNTPPAGGAPKRPVPIPKKPD